MISTDVTNTTNKFLVQVKTPSYNTGDPQWIEANFIDSFIDNTPRSISDCFYKVTTLLVRLAVLGFDITADTSTNCIGEWVCESELGSLVVISIEEPLYPYR